ncbi:MAG: hypothetical protein OXC31_19925, partial [Spirochaetaceae bacterium]|nr:hypothetical protein [Spirochaetaceae bacterium]
REGGPASVGARLRRAEATMSAGATISREFHPTTDRYAFDTGRCAWSRGWVQIDTTQDASYFGTWANLRERRILCFVEGDVITTTCATPESFAREMRRLHEWAVEAGCWLGVDADSRAAEWRAAGLGDLLHAEAA